MVWLCEHRPDVVDVEFELSEGGGGTTRFGREETKLFSIATNEKDICWLKLTSVGRPGHGSVPHADNSAVYLVQALNRLVEWERPLTFTPDTEAYVERLAEAGLMPRDRAEVEERIRQSPEMQAMFVNTLNLTMLNAGIKANVIPAKSEAVIDCRLLPGQSKDDWIRQVRERIADDRIEVELYSPDQGEPERVPWDTELFRAINDVVKEAMEDAVVVPGMTIGGTDNRFLRAMGIPAYGFIPCLLSPEERRGFHGNDEFMTVENFQMGCELMYEIVRRMVV
jgi:acetylornithine deacetylase/succinyl-diaminopimelate desuccinylase-like protein